jgi:3-oxoacyl-[acyl-carrier protein] reductase
LNILLTGGTRGLGLEIVRGQLELGHSLIVVNRSKTPQFEALQSAAPGRLHFVAVDLAQPDDLKESLNEVFSASAQPIHGLVNNAAMAYDDLVTNLNLDALEAMYRVNVYAPMLLTKMVIRNMLLHKVRGSLVHISSICAHIGYKGLAMYGSTKGALEAFSKNVAREWGSMGIRSNCVVPGFMETDMSSTLSEEQREKIYRRTSLGKATDPASVAETVSFLLSDASRSITGQDFVVDSGTL